MIEDELEQQSNNKIEKPNPLVLFLVDGWGIASESEANAWTLAEIPNIKQLVTEYPTFSLEVAKINLNARYLSLGLGQLVDDDNYLSEVALNSNQDLSKIIAANNLRQSKIFDSERVAALSYYFNAKREEKLDNEEWQLISAVNKQKIYDPFLSIELIFKALSQKIESKEDHFVIAVSSIIDYLASTGTWQDVVAGIEEMDKYLGRLAKIILSNDGTLIISSTQGKSEKIKDLLTGSENRAITTNPVPFIMINQELSGKLISNQGLSGVDLSVLKPEGSIANIKATILKILGINLLHDNQDGEESLF